MGSKFARRGPKVQHTPHVCVSDPKAWPLPPALWPAATVTVDLDTDDPNQTNPFHLTTTFQIDVTGPPHAGNFNGWIGDYFVNVDLNLDGTLTPPYYITGNVIPPVGSSSAPECALPAPTNGQAYDSGRQICRGPAGEAVGWYRVRT